MDKKKELEEFDKLVDETKKRLDNDSVLLMKNIKNYSIEEISELNIFFGNINDIFTSNFSKVKDETQMIKILKMSSRLKIIKEINDALSMFEQNFDSKIENNKKK